MERGDEDGNKKEIRRDIKTSVFIGRVVSIDRVLNKEHFIWENHAENKHQKLVPDPFLILLFNLKQPSHARNSFKKRYFERGSSKSPKKVNIIFSCEPSPF